MNRFLYLSIFLLLILSCGRSKVAQITTNDLIDRYVSEYQLDYISVKDPITLVFNQEIDVKNVSLSQLFTIQPKVEGTLDIKDSHILRFTPAEPLTYGSSYAVSVDLPKLFDTAEKGDVLQMEIRTKKLEMAIYIDKDPYYTSDKGTLKGKVMASDWVTTKDVESMVNVTGPGQMVWDDTSTGKIHSFTIFEIPRLDRPASFSIVWDGGKKVSAFKGERKFNIPEKGLFTVLSVSPEKQSRSIIIQFSDAIHSEQKLDGMVSIEGYDGKLRYDREGSVLTVTGMHILPEHSNINISNDLKSELNKSLQGLYTFPFSFEPVEPGVRLRGKGVITPYDTEIIFPFEARGLHAVDVEIFKVFSNNVIQHLQGNRLNETGYNLNPVGRIIHQEKVLLSGQEINPDYGVWNTYSLDLQKMVRQDPGALFIVRIGFRRDYTDYPCDRGVSDGPLIISEEPESIMRWNYDYEDYNYNQESDPCFPVFYNQYRFVQRNVLASNLGVIAKKGDNDELNIFVSDLRNLTPIVGAEVKVYDFQKQIIGTTSTQADGKSSMKVPARASFITIVKEKQYAYLDITDGMANSLTDFEIGGSKKKNGIDGYIYGERGVWRPGDTLHLTFVMEDVSEKIPANHPVSLRVTDSRGKQKYSRTMTRSINGMYMFRVPTEDNDPTGNWRAVVNIGDITFSKTLKIETIKPNRLKIDIDFEKFTNFESDISIPIQAQWLHGAPASGLKAKTEVTFSKTKTSFGGFLNYTFDDPARKLESLPALVFDDFLDQNGKGSIKLRKGEGFLPPGMINAKLFTRVYEPGGDFSEDNISTALHPYNSYAGIYIAESRWGQKMISGEEKNAIEFIAIDQNGKPLANRKLNIGLYKAEWHWWYSQNYSSIYQFDAANHFNALQSFTLTTDNKGMATYQPQDLTGYQYMIRACDPISGHCAGELFFTSNYNDDATHESAANLIRLTTDKTIYRIGDRIDINIPSNAESKILLSIEGGQGIITERWVEGLTGSTPISIPVTREMTPNIYVHVSLIQPFQSKQSSLPLRMYGVLPLKIEDQTTVLTPIIKAPQEIKPKSTYTVEVTESSGREMSYTLAVVDEGLLGLTRHQTPDLHAHFYAKQSLGVKTWDIYDMVLRGIGLSAEKHLSIGGDVEITRAIGDHKMSRFDPVVTVLGPFSLEKGKKNNHKLSMPNYMGEVRIMVVARHKNAYGNASQPVKVSNPLMVLPTVPRTLSPEEIFVLPVNVFTTKDNIRSVTVGIESTPGLEIIGQRQQSLSFDRIGDQMAFFDVQVKGQTGPVTITVKGGSSGESIEQKIHVQITDPNPPIISVDEKIVRPGEQQNIPYRLPGVSGSHSGYVELSTFPAINLGQRMNYLIQYPYGCLEQSVSSVFPQLYLAQISKLSETELTTIKNNINQGIAEIQKFQTAGGGLSYWKGQTNVSEWSTSYAGHFMMEARDQGFLVPHRFFEQWSVYQQGRARGFDLASGNDQNNLQQAYRLYTLAKLGQPDWASMNALRNKTIHSSALYLLAASYAIAGQTNVAAAMIEKVQLEIKDYQEMSYTFGSGLRDKALIVDAMLSSQIPSQLTNTAALIKEIASDLGNNSWHSTQSTAFALLAVGKYIMAHPPGDVEAVVRVTGKEQKINSATTVYRLDFDPEKSDVPNIIVSNPSGVPVFVRTVITGTAKYETSPLQSENLYLDVTYTDLTGKVLDITSLDQGTDFLSVVKVSNPGTRAFDLKEMALTLGIPSGWEIISDLNDDDPWRTTSDSYTFRDNRDDRVNIFFDMQKQKTFKIRLTATYAGKFYLPDTFCSAMYDNKIQARIPGKWIFVGKKEKI